MSHDSCYTSPAAARVYPHVYTTKGLPGAKFCMMNIASKTVLERHETSDLPSISFLSHYLLPGAAPEWLWAEPRPWPWLWAVATEQKSIGNKLSTENLM